MSKGSYYRGSGLLFRSDIALDDFAPAEPGPPDVVIETGPQAAQAAERAEEQSWAYGGFQISPDGPVIAVPGIAAYLITEGRHIAVSPAPNAAPGLMRLYLMGSALGMVFHQRGQLILHGAAVARGGALTLFTGPSGAGKSTLAAHLARRDYPVLGDDTLPLTTGSDDLPMAYPGARMFKLCEDAALRLSDTPLPRLAPDYGKVLFKNIAPAAYHALPLAEIVLLERGEGPAALHAIQGLQAVAMIAQNTYRPEYLGLLGTEARHFEQVAALSTHVRCYRLQRPWEPDRIEESLDVLEAHWRDAGSLG